jgi:hypothetical protein
MTKKELFIAAMLAGKYKNLGWLISAFTLTRGGTPDPESFKILSDQTGYSYFNQTVDEYVKVKDANPAEPLFKAKESIVIKPGDIPNVSAFDNKIDFINEKASLPKIESIILSRFEENPEDDSNDPTKIYVKEYLKYTEGVDYLKGLTQVFTQALTEKAIQPPPGVVELRNKLVEQYKDSLNDMASIAKIEKELIKHDAEYLKGDASEDFFISNKSRAGVRKKLYLMHGGELGLDENMVKATLIQKSLNEGLDLTQFPAINDTLRAGSFNRGAQTELGGVSVKWLLRASSNANVTRDDCGTKVGKPILVSQENRNLIVGFSLLDKGVSIPINTDEEAGQYLGKNVMLRSPMYCKEPLTDYCKICVGKRLALNPTALSAAVASYGNTFLALFLAKMHSSTLELAYMDINKAIT